jgi:hypothetical protein
MFAQIKAPEYLDIHFAEADARIHAPQSVLDVLDQMFAHLPRRWSGALPPIAINVAFESDMWQIGGSAPGSLKTLSQSSTLPQIAGAAVASLLAELSHHRNISVWRAAVVEFEGYALGLVGDDWESAITLAAHLHARGWRMVSGDYALVELSSMNAIPFRKSLHMSSSSVASFPLAYRGAIEASPWYSSTHAISFYAIDPTIVNGTSAWGERSVIRAVLKVDGRIGERPSLEAGENFAISETVSRSDLHQNVNSAMLILGGFIETADFIESWFSALVAAN